MSDLFCRSQSFSSSTSSSNDKKPVSSDEITIQDFQKSINNWTIPKITKNQIYEVKRFSLLKTDFTIKTVERDIQLSHPLENIHLLSPKTLQKHRERGYKYIHIGLVQVGIKPLTKEGLNTSIICVLRDARFLNFQDSLLSSIESSLCQGPISFEYHPDFSVSLSDKNILKTLVLQVKTHNYQMMEGSIPVALVFKIHYKAMLSAFTATKSFNNTKKGETMFLQTDLSRSNTVIPRLIQWKDISLPDEWILEGAVKPQSPKVSKPNVNLREIKQ